MVGGNFHLQKDNGYTGFKYIDNYKYSKFDFYYNHILIEIYTDKITLVLHNGKKILQDFSNIETNIRIIIRELHEKDDRENYAMHKLSIIWDRLVNMINKPDFTPEILNDVSFHVSPVKSARKTI
jgi:hypothetical protein